jgi:hypothetical protein
MTIVTSLFVLTKSQSVSTATMPITTLQPAQTQSVPPQAANQTHPNFKLCLKNKRQEKSRPLFGPSFWSSGAGRLFGGGKLKNNFDTNKGVAPIFKGTVAVVYGTVDFEILLPLVPFPKRPNKRFIST